MDQLATALGVPPLAVTLLVFAFLVGVAVLFYRFWLSLLGVVLVPNDSIGIVTLKFVLTGGNRTLPDGAIVALHGEAGIQADTLAPGVHYGYWPWQYDIRLEKFITVFEGHVGVVESRDGVPLSGGRVLARTVDCDSFQNARKFLENRGERGPQLAIIPPGTYRINTALFTVAFEEALDIGDNLVGIVTTKDGAPLRTGDIAGKEIAGHSMFQNPQAFIDAGGFKGLQEQVVLAGRYYFNPRFVTIETKDMTSVPIANVGVVISYVGSAGVDVSGVEFKHGNLVSPGEKGVWNIPLDPGKYPINPFTHKVELVPTANVVLNWATGKTESHKLDEKLSTIKVRSSDGFTFNLDVSQIIHIPRNEAPMVIARFGSMQNLITQVLEPTIGNYFRNAAQKSDVIDFLTSRQERQADAKAQIGGALEGYNVGAIDTLIGDITPPDELMKTLTDRKIASQQQKTFAVQKLAADERRELAQAVAMAETQPSVVTAERRVAIQRFEAAAAVESANGLAQSQVIQAEAEAKRLTLVGNATAGATRATGTAEADVIKLKIASMDSGNYAGIEVAKALAHSGLKLVPEILIGANGGDGGGGVIAALLATMLRNGGGRPTRTLATPDDAPQ